MAKKLKKEPLLNEDVLSGFTIFLRAAQHTWDRLPAEKQQQAREYFEGLMFATSFEELNALLSITRTLVCELSNVLNEVEIESDKFKEFLKATKKNKNNPNTSHDHGTN